MLRYNICYKYVVYDFSLEKMSIKINEENKKEYGVRREINEH